MKKLFALVFVFALLACNNNLPNDENTDDTTDTTTDQPADTGDPADTTDPTGDVTIGPPAAIDLSGMTAMFLQTGGASTASRDISSGDTTLMKILSDSSAEIATFEDADGNTVDVAVTRAKAINADYSLLTYEYEETSKTAIVDLATGELQAIEHIPANWDRIREKSGTIYYITDGTLYRLKLSDMTETALSGSYSLVSSSYLFVNSTGSVASLYMANTQDKRFYLFGKDGGLLQDMSGSTNLELFYDSLTEGSRKNMYVLEDYATQDLYRLYWYGTTVEVSYVYFDDTQGFYGDWSYQSVTMGGLYNSLRFGGTQARFDNSVFANTDQVFKFGLTSGRVTLTEYSLGNDISVYSDIADDSQYADGCLYACYQLPNSGNYHITRLDVSGATASESLLVNTAEITAFSVAGDNVYYSNSDGVYCCGSDGTIGLYSSTAADIEGIE